MRKFALLFILFASAIAVFSQANKQEGPTSPSSMTWNKRLYDMGTMMLLLSAEKMPEEFYSFKPTDTLLNFGEALADIADWQYKNCSVVRGEINPKSKFDAAKASKAGLIAALKDAFAYCGKAYDGLTEASAVQPVTFASMAGPMPMPRQSVLDINTGLNSLHYGNLMIYLRLKNIVPPSSDPDLLKKGAAALESPKTAATPSAGKQAFEKLKMLSGSWQGTIMNVPIALTIRAASSGTIIHHEANTAKGPPDHEITLFHLEDDRLIATHYCDAGNRARLEGKITPDGKGIEFTFLDVSGSTKGGLVRRMMFTPVDADKHLVEFTFVMPNGKPIDLRGEFGRIK